MTKVEKWLIISWEHVDHLNGRYGELLGIVEGTEEEAIEEARNWVNQKRPVGIVRAVS